MNQHLLVQVILSTQFHFSSHLPACCSHMTTSSLCTLSVVWAFPLSSSITLLRPCLLSWSPSSSLFLESFPLSASMVESHRGSLAVALVSRCSACSLSSNDEQHCFSLFDLNAKKWRKTIKYNHVLMRKKPCSQVQRKYNNKLHVNLKLSLNISK